MSGSDGRVWLALRVHLLGLRQTSLRCFRMESRSNIDWIRYCRAHTRLRIFLVGTMDRSSGSLPDHPALHDDLCGCYFLDGAPVLGTLAVLPDLLHPWCCRQWRGASRLLAIHLHLVRSPPG